MLFFCARLLIRTRGLNNISRWNAPDIGRSILWRKFSWLHAQAQTRCGSHLAQFQLRACEFQLRILSSCNPGSNAAQLQLAFEPANFSLNVSVRVFAIFACFGSVFLQYLHVDAHLFCAFRIKTRRVKHQAEFGHKLAGSYLAQFQLHCFD